MPRVAHACGNHDRVFSIASQVRQPSCGLRVRRAASAPRSCAHVPHDRQGSAVAPRIPRAARGCRLIARSTPLASHRSFRDLVDRRDAARAEPERDRQHEPGRQDHRTPRDERQDDVVGQLLAGGLFPFPVRIAQPSFAAQFRQRVSGAAGMKAPDISQASWRPAPARAARPRSAPHQGRHGCREC